MWCPHCQTEYEDGYTVCVKCGRALEDYTPILTKEEQSVLDLPDETPEPTGRAADALPELLAEVEGEAEARALTDRLTALRVPCLCRPAAGERGEAARYQLLVPKMAVAEARAILEEEEQTARRQSEQQQEADEAEPPAASQKGGFWARLRGRDRKPKEK